MAGRPKGGEARLARHKNGWRIRWSDGRRYDVYFQAEDETAAKATLDRVRLALKGYGDWPPEVAGAEAVRRWLDRDAAPVDDAPARYAKQLACSEGWRERSRTFVREFEKWCGDLRAATPAQAQSWLADVAGRQAMETRNKRLVVLKKFYKWARRTLNWPRNPFEAESQVRAARQETQIKYLTRAERDRVLAAADGVRDGLAAWIALYAGLRRNEIWRLRWEDIDLQAGRLVAQSKRGAPRTVPLAAPLLERLRQAAGKEATGPLFKFTDAAALGLLQRLQAALPDLASLIHYNVFRHTFCSLLAQAGVSIDKISSWSGHLPQVCRSHYARFTPRDGRDEDIDRL